jgi:hypothetical protein
LVEAKKLCYRERMKAARAEARAKREAEKAAWRRRIELYVEVRRMSLEVAKAVIRDRGDKICFYTPAQLRVQADEYAGPWLVAQAKARIAARTVNILRQSVTSPAASQDQSPRMA